MELVLHIKVKIQLYINVYFKRHITRLQALGIQGYGSENKSKNVDYKKNADNVMTTGVINDSERVIKVTF